MSVDIDAAAAKANDSVETPDGEEEEVETPSTSKKETSEEEEESEESTTDAARVKAAMQLYNALDNPATGPLVLKHLAEQAGLLSKDKEEKKEAAKDLIDQLKDELGEENEHLVIPFAKVLNKFVNAATEKAAKEAQVGLQQIQKQLAEQQMEARFERFIDKNEVSEDEADEINKLAKEIRPAEGISFEKYMSRLLSMVRGEKATVNSKAKTAQKQADNLKGRLPKPAGGNDNQLQEKRTSTKGLDLDAAVLRAAKQLEGA